jgi:hypothetical protein
MYRCIVWLFLRKALFSYDPTYTPCIGVSFGQTQSCPGASLAQAFKISNNARISCVPQAPDLRFVHASDNRILRASGLGI